MKCVLAFGCMLVFVACAQGLKCFDCTGGDMCKEPKQGDGKTKTQTCDAEQSCITKIIETDVTRGCSDDCSITISGGNLKNFKCSTCRTDFCNDEAAPSDTEHDVNSQTTKEVASGIAIAFAATMALLM